VKLLFLTQVLDGGDAVLGFVPRWIEGLARHAERVRVIALQVGDVTGLPPNVDVRVVGRKGMVLRYLRYRRYLREAFVVDGFDTVLAHMVPRYSLIAAGPASAAKARQFLWYTHGKVDERLRRAERVVEKIFTASAESMRLETEKRTITGHGIDLMHFAARAEEPAQPPRILSVGRLTPSKDPATVIEAFGMLVRSGRELALDFAGGGLAAGDTEYIVGLRRRMNELGLSERVHLLGPVPYRVIPQLYRGASVCVNASLTGSLDKSALEAMACRRPVVSCNEAFAAVVRELGAAGAALCFRAGDAASLAHALQHALDLSPPDRAALGDKLRAIVGRDHEVDALMRRLYLEMGGAP
jgi:glycosyltransferase involved in cell wall biosynthesis